MPLSTGAVSDLFVETTLGWRSPGCSLRWEAFPLADVAILVLRTASAIVAARGICSLTNYNASIHSPGGPLDHTVNRYQVFQDLLGLLRVYLWELRAVTNVSVPIPIQFHYLMTYWTRQEQSWCPYHFLLVWDKTCRSDNRARTLYSGYRKECTFLPFKRRFGLYHQITVFGRKVLFCGQQETKTPGAASVQGGKEAPIYVLPLNVVSNAGGRHRPSVDLQCVNASISTQRLGQSELTELRHIVSQKIRFLSSITV